jgi:hypothetical protein
MSDPAKPTLKEVLDHIISGEGRGTKEAAK